MTESTGSTQPPDWYRNPPEWLREPPARHSRYRDDDDDRDRGRYRSSRRDDEDLVTAIRAMPEQVVNALKEAIQGATQSQQPPQAPPQQQENKQEQQQSSNGGDDKPREQLTFADKWFSNSL